MLHVKLFMYHVDTVLKPSQFVKILIIHLHLLGKMKILFYTAGEKGIVPRLFEEKHGDVVFGIL